MEKHDHYFLKFLSLLINITGASTEGLFTQAFFFTYLDKESIFKTFLHKEVICSWFWFVLMLTLTGLLHNLSYLVVIYSYTRKRHCSLCSPTEGKGVTFYAQALAFPGSAKSQYHGQNPLPVCMSYFHYHGLILFLMSIQD